MIVPVVVGEGGLELLNKQETQVASQKQCGSLDAHKVGGSSIGGGGGAGGSDTTDIRLDE